LHYLLATRRQIRLKETWDTVGFNGTNCCVFCKRFNDTVSSKGRKIGETRSNK
jgi:hypothetical protein